MLKIAAPALSPLVTNPVTLADLEEASRANALFDAHQHDPESGTGGLLQQSQVLAPRRRLPDR